MRWLVALMIAASLAAQPKVENPFNPLDFLMGTWVGEGSGDPGQGSGEFSFEYDLDRKILIRRNTAQYPAQADRAAYRHDDLMIVYREATALRAIYFDNEDHIIQYSIEASSGSARFISAARPDQPRYRLTYRKTGAKTINLEFEIAPPGKPEAFANYITSTVHRKAVP